MKNLGSVVRLVGGKKKLMIFGRLQINTKDNKSYDYIGCLFPEGNIGEGYSFLFNESDIEETFCYGYGMGTDHYADDQDEVKFRKIMKDYQA